MVRVGLAAPPFDCAAVVNGGLTPLSWQQVHEGRALVLVFGPLAALAQSAERFLALADAAGRLQARLALVCREPPGQVLAWAVRSGRAGGLGRLGLLLLTDGEQRAAGLYDLAAPDGTLLWGRFLI